MREFTIRLRSVRDVQEFVALATTMGFPVLVDDGHHRVNGSSFMEMFCLDCTQPLTATAECTDEEFQQLYSGARKFMAN